ncbi:MAG TPA: hypothetical protein VG412_13745 [Acidimicrobiales bacterium]|nr:hypothetical protein [Acidimicrobiales bacterium]
MNSTQQASSYVRNVAAKVDRRVAQRYIDVELRQLRSLQRAYRGSVGPELLMFGESNMSWTLLQETDRRHVAEMIRDDLGAEVRLEGLVGPGYNPRIIMAFLAALPACASQPKVVIVPMSVLMATSTWLAHPKLGYEHAARELRELIEAGDSRTRRLQEPTEAAWDAFDHLPAPSLIGARRTVGELRLITSATPTTRWQQVVRLRHLMDYYNAERLEPESPGVTLVADMATLLKAQGLHSVAYVPPINFDVTDKVLGAESHAHIVRNADLIAASYREAVGDFGTVVNAAAECPGSDFADPLHLLEGGRRRLAGLIAAAIRPYLG